MTVDSAKELPLIIESVEVSTHCQGEEWLVIDFDRLAYLIAIIALGQAHHAAMIVHSIDPTTAVLGAGELKAQASAILTVQGATPWIRDGFLFECISWIAAQQTAGPNDYLKDPHIKSTTQGLDGLLIRVVAGQIEQATIFEDKCSENPRGIFSGPVMKSFQDYHRRTRSAELLATTSELLRQAHLPPDRIITAAARILRIEHRRYRARLAVGPDVNDRNASTAVRLKSEQIQLVRGRCLLGSVGLLGKRSLNLHFFECCD